MMILKRLRKILLWLLLALVLWCGWLGWRITRGAGMDETRRADVAIVLGAAAYGDKPSPVFEQRIAHAVELYRKGTVRKIILTGGFGDGAQYSESEVAQRYAVEQGVPSRDLLLEKKSRTTLDNLRYARDLMKENGFKSALLVSDPLHMERAAWMMQDLGITAWRSPTLTTRYTSFESRAGFLAREIYAVTAYIVGGI
ncbi:MAG TPA: YdcF family protein [Verrucomicrobiales bacterium]|nr:YdcF family protein [Verrucomicrobiales bacterium]